MFYTANGAEFDSVKQQCKKDSLRYRMIEGQLYVEDITSAQNAEKPSGEYKGTVYLIHFSRPFHHASHYIGWTRARFILGRIRRHKAGHGARILRALVQNCIPFKVVRVWQNVDRNFERKLKNRKQSSVFCPVCVAAKNGVKA